MLLLDPVLKPKERPLPMKGPLVLASLADLKTHTRRTNGLEAVPEGAEFHTLASVGHPWHDFYGHNGAATHRVRCPYGSPGDRIWIREAWRALRKWDHLPPRLVNPTEPVWYEADGPIQAGEPSSWGKLRPPMFMPRWACRLVLELVDVLAERLQEISEADALAEGIEAMRCPDCHLAGYGLPGWGHDQVNPSAAAAYRYLWESINGEGSWDLNPWCWVLVYRRVQP